MVYVNAFGHPQGMPLQKIKHHKSYIKTMENKTLWGKILKFVITVLTAIATTFGIQACV